jgi:hypothetical protein
LLDARELVPPIAFESARPLIDGPDCFDVGAIQNLATIPPQIDETNIAKDAQMLGDRRLRQAQCHNDLPDRTLVGCEEIEDGAPLRFGNGVEHIRVRSSTWHKAYPIPMWEYVKPARVRSPA